MKNLKTALLATMILVFTNSFAQTVGAEPEKNKPDNKSTKTYLDIMVNVVSTNINYGGSNSALAGYKKATNGIQAGMSFQAGISPVFSLVSELYYMRKGGKLKVNTPLTASESTLRLNTLELPVLARIHVGKFYMNAGPSIAYNISGKREINNQPTKLLFNNSNEAFKRFESGIQMGGGLEFPIKQKRIALDIRYNYGLTNISNNKEIHNRALMISLHFSKAWKSNPLGRK